VWPALPAGDAAAALALLQQLEASQWLPEPRLRELQQAQFDALLRHARATVPFYRARLGKEDAPPILTRGMLRENFAALRSERYPPEHGPTHETRTSGATGMPVRVLKTELSQLLWKALTLRDHAWHRRDFSLKLAVIRRGVSPGTSASWGPATAGLVRTGPCVSREVDASAEALLDWLMQEQPDYLLSYPSLVAEMARLAQRRGQRRGRLREVRTLGEAVSDETRSLCREAWGATVVDMYSCEEAGYLAFQCPESDRYHVQAEAVLVEVLDGRGVPCRPGETGRVVVTPLHDFAMPLIRYEIGDYAEVGEPCPCGRGLPVLRRVLGRVRNMLVTADGARYWPAFGLRAVFDIEAVRQRQLVQTGYDTLEVRLVTAAPLGAEDEQRIRERVGSRLPAGFRVSVVYREELPRSTGGKFEDFICEVA
jgi:phenylacetate-CoA ligase